VLRGIRESVHIKTCCECGGATKVIACIEDPMVIHKILDHLEDKTKTPACSLLPESRAPPVDLFG